MMKMVKWKLHFSGAIANVAELAVGLKEAELLRSSLDEAAVQPIEEDNYVANVHDEREEAENKHGDGDLAIGRRAFRIIGTIVAVVLSKIVAR